MIRKRSRTTSAGILFMSTGCGITGTWRIVTVVPEGSRPPLATATFDGEGHFTTTTRQNGRERTRTGVYRWNGRRLTILATTGRPRIYRARRRLNGQLVLVHQDDGRKITSTYERITE